MGRGILLEEQKLKANIELLDSFPQKSLLKVIIREGRNRQIKRVTAELGHPVIDLERVAIDQIKLNDEEWQKIIS